MTTSYIGIDLHRTVIQICVLDEHGEVVAQERLSYTSLDEGLRAVEVVKRFAPGCRVAVEALGLNRWFVNACRAEGLDVLVCDARKLGLRKLGKKTDRRDAHEIARRLWLGDLDRMARTYYPSDAEYGRRKLLRVRHHLVHMRQQTTNQLRAMLNAYQLEAPRTVLYTRPSQAKLAALRLPEPELQVAFDALRAVLERIQVEIQALSRRIDALPRQEPELGALVAMFPRIGAQSAATLRAELGDPRRFRNARAVAAYAGLVPRVAQSADTAHHGRLTKQGNPELRWILSQWAVRLVKDDPLVAAWAARLRRRVHRNKVRMALARRLLVGVWITLTRGEAFDLRRCLGLA
ncbi:MAG TPA: IS110 family transposase [Thermoleophilaceae bacterium]|nr:IS110 family transposase [Thermoleophilaceae bacterium]